MTTFIVITMTCFILVLLMLIRMLVKQTSPAPPPKLNLSILNRETDELPRLITTKESALSFEADLREQRLKESLQRLNKLF